MSHRTCACEGPKVMCSMKPLFIDRVERRGLECAQLARSGMTMVVSRMRWVSPGGIGPA